MRDRRKLLFSSARQDPGENPSSLFHTALSTTGQDPQIIKDIDRPRVLSEEVSGDRTSILPNMKEYAKGASAFLSLLAHVQFADVSFELPPC
jgi:hypothetical protein